ALRRVDIHNKSTDYITCIRYGCGTQFKYIGQYRYITCPICECRQLNINPNWKSGDPEWQPTEISLIEKSYYEYIHATDQENYDLPHLKTKDIKKESIFKEINSNYKSYFMHIKILPEEALNGSDHEISFLDKKITLSIP